MAESDAANCGSCGLACAQGQMCVQGQCQGYCPAPHQSCADSAGKPVCRDLRNDVDNCGACGTVCPGGQVCSQGLCNLQCAPPQTLCPSTTSPVGICTNLQSDNSHCGTCDLICPGNLVCVQGRCGPCGHTSIPGAVMLLDFAPKPTSLEVADLDNDGVLDLVAVSASENTATVRLGNGDGSFADPQAITTGKAPKAVAVGDFDGDEFPDLAVANNGGSEVVVLQGVPEARTWRETRRLTLPSAPTALAAADLDLDGRADLAVAMLGPASGELLLLLSGRGETIATALRIPVQSMPNAVLLTDLDKDGRPDIVVSLQEGTVAVALTGVDGGPGSLRRFVTGPGCNAVLTVDLNDDSRPDLVTSSTGDNSLRVLLGQGDGSFGQAVRYDMGVAPAGLATADIDGDGRLDVLTGVPAVHGVRVLPGLGHGTLGTAKLILAGSSPVEIRAADLNRDGKPDLVAAHANDKSRALSVILARDTGVYAPPTQALSDEPDAMRVVDLDSDAERDGLCSLTGTGGFQRRHRLPLRSWPARAGGHPCHGAWTGPPIGRSRPIQAMAPTPPGGMRRSMGQRTRAHATHAGMRPSTPRLTVLAQPDLACVRRPRAAPAPTNARIRTAAPAGMSAGREPAARTVPVSRSVPRAPPPARGRRATGA